MALRSRLRNGVETMQFKITRLGEFAFVIQAPSGESIRPVATHDVVTQLEQEFQINPKGIRFFWPDDDEIDMIIAVLRDRVTRRSN
jgi:hypothetical protein